MVEKKIVKKKAAPKRTAAKKKAAPKRTAAKKAAPKKKVARNKGLSSGLDDTLQLWIKQQVDSLKKKR